MKKKSQREEEFERILEKFANSIRAQVLSADPGKMGIDPEDMLQEIRVRLWKRLGREKKVAHLPSYIKKVVSSVLIDEIRKARIQKEVVRRAEEEKLGARLSEAEKPRPKEPLSQVLEEAVESLMESRRLVMKLFLLGLTNEEIATILNWSPDKTRNLLYRGLADIKKNIKKGAEGED